MRPLLLVLMLALSAGQLLSADAPLIDSSGALNYIKQNVTVSGLVTNVFVSKHGNAFINFGEKYPNQTFTGWIPAGTPLVSDPLLQELQGKTVKITGVIELSPPGALQWDLASHSPVAYQHFQLQSDLRHRA